MENISNVLFWISNGLLVPVIVGLLYFFIRAASCNHRPSAR